MAGGIWNRFQSLIFGGAIGAAATEAIAPALEPARQHAWEQNQVRILDPRTLAALVAQGAITLDVAVATAARNGYDSDKTRALIHLELLAPPYAEVLDLWRRNPTRPPDEQISEAQVDHALAKAQIERQYWPALKELVSARLSAPEIALGIVRGIIQDPGILPVAPPTEQGKVPAFPVFPIDALAEAQSTGFDRDRLSVYVGTMGRPMAANEAARASFRQIIDRVDFDRAIAEGDIRNEWRDALYEVAREILTANEYAELQLRGYIGRDERLTKTAQHGMSQEDSDLLYNLLGRSIPVHQITTGFARGGTFDGPTDQIPPAYLQSLQRGNLRPEYYNLAYANRYSLPGAFVVRQLLKDGALTAAQGEQIFLEEGWPPDLAKLVAEHYAASTTAATVDPHTKSAQTRYLTALHRQYVGGAYDLAQTQTALAGSGLTPAAQTAVLDFWTLERNLAPPPAPIVGTVP